MIFNFTAIVCSGILWKWLFGARVAYIEKESIIWIYVCYVAAGRSVNVVYDRIAICKYTWN